MRWLNRIIIALIVAAALAVLPRQLSSDQRDADYDRMVSERDALLQDNEKLAVEIQMLEAEVRSLHLAGEGADAYARAGREIQRIAREDLNLIRPGEWVFEIDRIEEKEKNK